MNDSVVLFSRGPVSDAIKDRSRKNEQTILQALAATKQKAVALDMGVEESTVSRIKSSGDIEKVSALIAACGLKVVPVSMKCYRPEDIDPYIQIAKQHMEKIKSADQLVWEDD